MTNRILVGFTTLPLLLIGASAAHAMSGPQSSGPWPPHLPPVLVDDVRTANGRFVDVSVALQEGYAPIPCVTGADGGGMGVHYVNAALINDDAIDVAHPEAVMYEPQPDGSLSLIAVEYITAKGPAALEGHLFSFTGMPNRYGLGAFYELHVWAWRRNATGTFADMNPSVSCDSMPAD